MPPNDPSRTHSLSQWERSSFREIAMWLLDLMLPLPTLVGSLSPNFQPVHGLILARSIPCRKFLTT